MSDRILEQAPYGSGVEELVLPQLIGRSLLMAPSDRKGRRDASFQSSPDFWSAVLDERLVAERVVTLENMRLFEWFPRNPGLFHTRRAKQAREIAQHHIMQLDDDKYRQYVNNADAPPDHAALIRSVTQSDEPARTRIFTPHGKISMVQGGIGCVRYQAVKLVGSGAGGVAWFMSADSGLAPDEGIPLLVPDEIYQDQIDRIKETGFAPVTVRGRVRFIADQFRDLYSTKHGIPRLYVDVEEMEYSPVSDHGYGLVSVAASFAAEIDGQDAIYAAYVTFDPGHEGARRSAIDWMQDEYVRGLYKGEMLTDFDQQSPSFSDKLFSLQNVMTSPDLASTIMQLRRVHGYFEWEMLEQRTINFNVDRRDMRMEVNIGGNAQNVVIGGHGSTNSLVINQSQLQDLARDLHETRQALKAEADFEGRDRISGALEEAEDAAKAGDADGVTGALKRLKPLRKIGEIAEKIGVGLAVAAIKAAIGF